jgi:hypothetical protein
LVPKKISYSQFIGGCIFLFLLFIFLIPGLVDIAEWTNSTENEFMRGLMKFNYMLMNLFTAKLFTPAMNVLLNYYLEKPMRTALNSIFYLGVSFTVYALNLFTKKVMNYFFDDLVAPPTPWIKY